MYKNSKPTQKHKAVNVHVLYMWLYWLYDCTCENNMFAWCGQFSPEMCKFTQWNVVYEQPLHTISDFLTQLVSPRKNACWVVNGNSHEKVCSLMRTTRYTNCIPHSQISYQQCCAQLGLCYIYHHTTKPAKTCTCTVYMYIHVHV